MLCIESNYINLLSVIVEKKNSCLVRDLHFLWALDHLDFLCSLTSDTIKLLVNYGVKIDNKELLKQAIRKDNYKVVEYLLDFHKNILTLNQENLFEIALKNKSWNSLKLLIKNDRNINIDVNGGMGRRPLIYWITKNKEFEIVELIFQKYPNLDRSSLVALLHEEIKKSHFEMVIYLLNLDVDVNIKNKEGQNALHLAVESNCIETVKLLLEKPPEFIEDKYGTTPTGVAVTNGNIEIVRLLPIDNKKKCYGQTLLHIASKSGNIEMVKYIFNKIKGVNEKDYKEWTTICYAAYNGYFDIFEFFVNCKANIEIVGIDGKSLLNLAAKGRN